MFGYVNICKSELKVKDFYKYKAYYCGLCRSLKENYGFLGQMTLTYDMTFLIILLTSLYETDTKREQHRCIVHPAKKHDMLVNEITKYVSDMNIALTYHHFLDDWQDEKALTGLAGAKLLKREYKRIYKQYPRQCRQMEQSLQELLTCENNKESNIDIVSRCFGELMAELFVYKKDTWEDSLRKIGFYLGKFIYIMDAYDDVEKDIKNKSYNPVISLYKETEEYENECRNMMAMMMAECTEEFEKLPCLLDIDILRNILYMGVWTKFDNKRRKRNEKEGKSYDNGSI